MGTGTRMGMGTRTGSGRAEERRRSARNRTRTVDAIRHFYSARVIISADMELRLRAPGSSVRKAWCLSHHTEGVTGYKGREGSNEVESGIGVGGGNGDGNGVGGGNGSGDGAGTGVGKGVETRGRTQDGDGDGSGDGNESSSGDGNGDEDGNGGGDEGGIGEGGEEKKERKKPYNKSCRRHVGNGGDFGGKRKKCRKERVGPVAANPDHLENNKEAGRGTQDTQGLSKNCASRESVSPLSRLIRGFCNKYH